MTWVVDTSVLIDVAEDDPDYGAGSARALDDLQATHGIAICPLTYAELGPAFEGSQELQEEFLRAVGIDFRQDWTQEDTLAAFRAWTTHVRRRRAGRGPRRPIADLLIGAFASRFDGLVTRNPSHFRTAFPNLDLLDPSG